MGTLLWAIGLVLCVEGLVLALAPTRLEEVLELIRRLPPEMRRLLGLAALAAGVAMLSLVRSFGL